MSNLLTKLVSLGGNARIKRYRALVQSINDAEQSLVNATDSDLFAKACALRERANAGSPIAKLIVPAFSLIREASKRSIGLRHYDVQLMGALALSDGCIAEMKTGEGKTLVSTAAGFLESLAGDNVHIVTVNDYLAKRDAAWMGEIYRFLGMKTGVICNGMSPADRKIAYAANVTYGTNSEFGFDYLRDNMAKTSANRVQRGHHFAIVDEVDSILIDEARTPLIISGPGGATSEDYAIFARIVAPLKRDKDYVYDEKKKIIYPTEQGIEKAERQLGQDIYADLSGRLANHLRQALKAEFMMKRDVDYVVVDGEVKIVDEFTGRIMEGRRWSEGLHQAVEAKEGVEVKSETTTLATVTLQNYFRLYETLSGMTGTALTEDAEFRHIYHLPVVAIPTNKPVIRIDRPDYIFRNLEAKFTAVADEVERRHATGQPILVGTTSIKASERLSTMLDERKIPHQTLNAKNHEREAKIVANAGRLGAVTIATNMAGRGTDILLGGSPKALEAEWLSKLNADPENPLDWQIESARSYSSRTTSFEGYATRALGGLYVIGTERHESRRIDDQLRGRAGRQGDPGESRFFLSLEDPLLKRFGGERLDAVAKAMEKQGAETTEPLEDDLVTKVIDTAQRQVESIHYGSRKHVLEYDDVMDLQRKAIYEERNAVLDGKNIAELLPEIASDVLWNVIESDCPDDAAPDDWDFADIDALVRNLTGREAFSSAALLKAQGLCAPCAEDVLAECERFVHDLLLKKRCALGNDAFESIASNALIAIMDAAWIEHLQEMDYLKTGIGLRSYGHKDPLVEYKDEAYAAFEALANSLYERLLEAVLHIPETLDSPISSKNDGR